MTWKTYKDAMDRATADYSNAKATLKAEKLHLTKAILDADHAAQSLDILRGVSQSVQEQAHARLAAVVSRCLEMVFDEPYEFRIVFEQKRRNTEARIVFVRDGKEISPLHASGGGVVDVAAFALRLACIMLARPSKRLLLVFDEPFKFVSADYRPRIREMVEQLAADMGVQFIAVTHIDELRTGNVVEITS